MTKTEKRPPKWVYAVCGSVGFIYFTLSIVYFALPNGKINNLDLIAPASWVFIKSGINTDIGKGPELRAIEDYRQSISLPTDRDWLDQREHPIYPLVTAEKEVVKAYNPDYTDMVSKNRV